MIALAKFEISDFQSKARAELIIPLKHVSTFCFKNWF